MILDEIAIRYGTDKASSHPVGAHNYCAHYERFFDPVRKQPIKVLEIGVGGGESIRTWIEYFPRAQIYGVDVVHDTNPWNSLTEKPEPRYTFTQGDQSCPTFWACFLADYGRGWDIIIDDGSHVSKDIFTTFKAMWPQLNPGGMYCIEDLNCSYGGVGSHFTPANFPTHMDWIKRLLDEINQESTCEVESLQFSKELAILTKKRYGALR